MGARVAARIEALSAGVEVEILAGPGLYVLVAGSGTQGSRRLSVLR
jgi:hypothetical protein